MVLQTAKYLNGTVAMSLSLKMFEVFYRNVSLGIVRAYTANDACNRLGIVLGGSIRAELYYV